MPDQPSPRRRFQFRLRTLLVGVTAFCGGTYVINEKAIVQQRVVAFEEMQQQESKQAQPAFLVDVSRVWWLRRWLGDLAVTHSFISGNEDVGAVRRFHAAFPEARLLPLWSGAERSEIEKQLREICDESQRNNPLRP